MVITESILLYNRIMKTLIIGNWKCNPTSQKEAKHIFDGIKRGVKNAKAELVVCPPFLYLSELKGLILGAQNIFYKEKGAFTGEISAMMLKDLKVEYVIIGHSERRNYFAETNEDINKKIKAAIETGLKPIFCVGENESEDSEINSKNLNGAGKNAILENQIKEGLAGISKLEIQNSKLVIAYEPVWAIGTGKNCSVDETMSAILLIRKIIANMYNREVADGIRILYGGSVKSENSAGYIKEGGANGLLVGGASLIAEEFVKIVKSAE